MRIAGFADFVDKDASDDAARIDALVNLARHMAPLAADYEIPVDVPYRELDDRSKQLIEEGVPDRPMVDPTAVVHPAARIGAGTRVEPHAVIGEHVKIGRNCRIGASTVIGGFTEIGDDNEIFPMASIGLIPQDLKFGGEQTRLVIGNRNVIREFVTIHRGTAGGGGVTSIGDHNLFMAYTHIAHDCHVGNETIFANGATLGGHVTVDDFATISAYSGVHQFCRVGAHAMVGFQSHVSQDVPPFMTVSGHPEVFINGGPTDSIRTPAAGRLRPRYWYHARPGP